MENVINKIRNVIHGDYILKYFEYNDEVVFAILSKNYKQMETNDVQYVTYNMNTKTIERKSPLYPLDLMEAGMDPSIYKNAKTVDKI